MSFSVDGVVETFSVAAEENQISPLRKGQVVHLPGQGELWMTGDIHDHRRNFEKLVKAADLGNHPDRHLVLHELIHGDHFDLSGAEESWITLYRAAELKCDFPSQVHFLLANHDLAQIHGEGIMKGGLSVCEAFNAGVKKSFGPSAATVTYAITQFLISSPLAVRADNGIFCCHSLPTDEQVQTFDYSIFDRELTGKDYARRTGPVYQLIWGRNITPQAAAAFADRVGARTIITGHQPQETGFVLNGPRHLIIASDHNQGVFLPIELSESYEAADLVSRLRKFVSLT